MKQELEWLRDTLRIHDTSQLPSMTGLELAKYLKQYKTSLKPTSYKKELLNDDLCKCGHKRELHNVILSHNYNYTDGKCNEKECDCKYFLIS